MINPATITTWIDTAEISQFLAADDNSRQGVMQWGTTKGNNKLPFLLGFFADIVGWAFTWDSSSTNFQAVATYMYSLCGKYIAQANQILDNAGGVIVNPSTGVKTSISFLRIQFTVGQPGSPMNAGDTELTINVSDILNQSISVETPNANLPENDPLQVSVSVAYSDDNAVVTFNQGVSDGETYIVTGLYFIPLV